MKFCEAKLEFENACFENSPALQLCLLQKKNNKGTKQNYL